MKKVIIIGSGAVAAELTSYLDDNNRHLERKFKIDLLGYIEYENNIEKYWKKYKLTKPVIGNIDDYIFEKDVEVLVAISNIEFRNQIIKVLEQKNVKFHQFVHHSVIIPKDLVIGEGNIIYPFCIIGPNSKIGNFNIFTSYSFISHDCIVGDRNVFSTSGLAGNVKILDNNFFGIRSTVLPKVSIGNWNVIQAGMIVDKSIDDRTTVFYRHKEKIIAIPKADL